MIEIERTTVTEPNEIALRFNIIQATSINQFRTPDGKKNIHLHYFWQNDKGEILYLWIEEITTKEWLEKNIKEKRIYLFKDKK